VDFASGVQTAWAMGVRMYTAEFWWSGGAASGEDGGGETAWQNLLRDNGEFLRRVLDTCGS
jgi:hypothetical protein